MGVEEREELEIRMIFKIQVYQICATEKAVSCFLLCAYPAELMFSVNYQLCHKDLNVCIVLLNSQFIVAQVN